MRRYGDGTARIAIALSKSQTSPNRHRLGLLGFDKNAIARHNLSWAITNLITMPFQGIRPRRFCPADDF
ncbi:hypothetical protein I8752_29230 [Nostocaceae cyanobacterium CENA369]|uniref:Uncharacterized protein n=1 Tax=Dendronalium phyllosphericum CENA369 TaxID=1725256 RepID=A0A8J7IA97_9NOST|nr:hypothetical protein [Dendronalium phyllosphericum CENA369]